MTNRPVLFASACIALILHVLAMIMTLIWSAVSGLFESGSESGIVFGFILPLILIFAEAYIIDRLYVHRMHVSHKELYYGIPLGVLGALVLFTASILVFGALPKVF